MNVLLDSERYFKDKNIVKDVFSTMVDKENTKIHVIKETNLFMLVDLVVREHPEYKQMVVIHTLKDADLSYLNNLRAEIIKNRVDNVVYLYYDINDTDPIIHTIRRLCDYYHKEMYTLKCEY